MHPVSRRFEHIPFEGGIREILASAAEIENRGEKVIHFEIGRPDFDSPRVAKEGAQKALDEGFVHYTPLEGIPELRKAIAEQESRWGKEAEAASIVVTCGAVEAEMVTFMALLNPGDEVLIPTPCFPAYFDQVYLAGGVPVSVPSRLDEYYRVDFEGLRNAVTERTKILIINSPNNPSGGIIPEKDLKKLADFAEEFDLYVITDDCYQDFVFTDENANIYAFADTPGRVIGVNSLSKTFSMTGWRIGYILCPPDLYPYFLKTHQMLSTSACSFAQKGAVEALRSGSGMTREMVAEMERRRDVVVGALQSCEGLRFAPPKGAFYAFPSIECLDVSALEFCTYLLEKEGVATVPGDAFGSPGYVRIAFTCSRDDVSRGMEKFAAAYGHFLGKKG
ncbi:MAG: pyridoxal phosphate-dependent aminotransferase [Synergistales bacterium]|nr:pyridoxal phosphate-dependent aminotransferase [Synergistales bacterium]